MESSRTVGLHDSGAPPIAASRDTEIASLVRQIRDVFERHFDRSWLAVVIDDLPLDHRTVREIREFVCLSGLDEENEHRIESGIVELRRYVWTLKKHLLPNVKELLGVSPFSARRGMDKSQFVLRRLTAHAIPYNLAQLEALVDALEIRFRTTCQP